MEATWFFLFWPWKIEFSTKIEYFAQSAADWNGLPDPCCIVHYENAVSWNSCRQENSESSLEFLSVYFLHKAIRSEEDVL